MVRMATTWMAGVLAFTALGCATVPPRPAARIDLEERVQGARSAEDHEAIARAYDEEARAAITNAERHERMAASYSVSGRGPVGRLQLARHCDDMAREYRAIAKDAADMAAAHRDAAKAMR